VLGRTCFVKESQRYPDTFTVRHALRAAALVYPLWDQALADGLVADFGLPVDRRITKLARGMLSAVGVVIGLASRAPLTFFDEPYLGLDAVARQLFYDRLLADYTEHPRTIVLSTHLIDEVSDLIEHVVLLDRGRVLLDADAEDLRSSAVTVSGPTAAVEGFVAGRRELHREGVGGFLRVTVSGAPVQPVPGLRFEPVSLQQLVVRATQTHDRQPVGVAAQGGLR
jgi:ABC-2 type transport system ATP-binding protein